MRVDGERYFLVNLLMNLLCLILTARLTKLPFRSGRAIAAAMLGSVYAVAALAGQETLRQAAFLFPAGLGMALLAFGRQGLRAYPGLLAAGFLLAGLCRYLLGSALSAPAVIGVMAAFCAGLWYLPLLWGAAGEQLELCLTWHGRSVTLPALRDSGNLLHDPISGLPVVIASRKMLGALLPADCRPQDLATLPPGCYFIRIMTAAGSRTLMGFRPEKALLRRGKKKWPVHAAVAISDFEERRALLPQALFRQEARRSHADR